MNKFLNHVAVGFGIYFVLLILNVLYHLFHYKKKRINDKKFFTYLFNEETFRGNVWFLPFAIASIMVYHAFIDNSIYKIVVLISTAAVGVDFIVTAFYKKSDDFEKKLQVKKILIGVLIFLLFSINIFWYKEAVKMFSAKYVVMVLTILLSVKLIFSIINASKSGKELKTVEGFYFMFGMTACSFILILVSQFF